MYWIGKIHPEPPILEQLGGQPRGKDRDSLAVKLSNFAHKVGANDPSVTNPNCASNDPLFDRYRWSDRSVPSLNGSKVGL